MFLQQEKTEPSGLQDYDTEQRAGIGNYERSFERECNDFQG